jgi:hypothetical protein
MESKDIQLPAEVVNAINKGAQETLARASTDLKYSAGYFDGYSLGATEYAIMLHQEQQENIQLKRWKKEQLLVWGPLCDYGLDSGGLKVGGSIPAFILERCKQFEQARQLLFRLASLVNAEQTPDEIFLTEIKTFLDGTI